MEYQTLGRSPLRVSRLGLGSAGFAALDGRDVGGVPRLLDAFLDAGGTLVDTADSYSAGRCEQLLGLHLAQRRDRLIVSSKVGWPSPENPGGLSRRSIQRAVEGSLRRLRTDHIDLYQLHLYDDSTPLEQTLEALGDCVQAGKAKVVGASAFHAWQLATANGLARLHGWPRLESVQLAYNLAQRDVELDHLGYCLADEVAMIVYSPLHGGVLSGSSQGGRLDDPALRHIYLGRNSRRRLSIGAAVTALARRLGLPPAQVSLAWLLRRPAVASVLIGPDNVAELHTDLAALSTALPDAETSALDEISAPDLPYPNDFYQRKSRMWTYFSAQNRAPHCVDP